MPPDISLKDLKRIQDYINGVNKIDTAQQIINTICKILENPENTPEIFSQKINNKYLLKIAQDFPYISPCNNIKEKILQIDEINKKNGFQYQKKDIDTYVILLSKKLYENKFVSVREFIVYTLGIPIFLIGSVFWELCIIGIGGSLSNAADSIEIYVNILDQIKCEIFENNIAPIWTNMFLLKLLTAFKTIFENIIPYERSQTNKVIQDTFPFAIQNLINPLIEIMSVFDEDSKTYYLIYEIISKYLFRAEYQKPAPPLFSNMNEYQMKFKVETYQIDPFTSKYIIEKIISILPRVSNDIEHPNELPKYLIRFSQCLDFLVRMSTPQQPLDTNTQLCLDIIDTILNYWGFPYIRERAEIYCDNIFSISLNDEDRKRILRTLYSYHDKIIIPHISGRKEHRSLRGDEFVGLSREINSALVNKIQETKKKSKRILEEQAEYLKRLKYSIKYTEIQEYKPNIREELSSFFYPPEDPLMEYLEMHPPKPVDEPFFFLQ